MLVVRGVVPGANWNPDFPYPTSNRFGERKDAPLKSSLLAAGLSSVIMLVSATVLLRCKKARTFSRFRFPLDESDEADETDESEDEEEDDILAVCTAMDV